MVILGQVDSVCNDVFDMKMRVVIQLMAVALLCLMSFLFGKWSGTKNVITYSVGGTPTSFNVAWPLYGLNLTDNTSILFMLRNSHSEEAITQLEVYLDSAIYDAEYRRPLLHGRNLNELDKCLIYVANYREKFPRHVSIYTNNVPFSPYQLQQLNKWVAEQKGIDTFLNSFVSTNVAK